MFGITIIILSKNHHDNVAHLYIYSHIERGNNVVYANRGLLECVFLVMYSGNPGSYAGSYARYSVMFVI